METSIKYYEINVLKLIILDCFILLIASLFGDRGFLLKVSIFWIGLRWLYFIIVIRKDKNLTKYNSIFMRFGTIPLLIIIVLLIIF